MRQTLPFLILVSLCSCQQQNKQETTTKNEVPNSIATTTSKDPAKKTIAQQPASAIDLDGWRKNQDSLRNEILKRKENRIVKESLLQELYIRSLVTIANDSLFFRIPFDLHGLDCIAPDCYQTDVSFAFELGATLKFPQEIKFKEHEHGCVSETRISGSFQLRELDSNHVIFHSSKYKRTLVLFKDKQKRVEPFYFTKVGVNRIKGTNFDKIFEDYKEDDKNSIYPFRSTVLFSEYENFIKQD